MNERLVPLDPGLRRVLRATPLVPAGARERVRARLGHTIPAMRIDDVGSGVDLQRAAEHSSDALPRLGPSVARPRLAFVARPRLAFTVIDRAGTFIAGGISGAALVAAMASHGGWARPSLRLADEATAVALLQATPADRVGTETLVVSDAAAVLPHALAPFARPSGSDAAEAAARRASASSRFSAERALLDEVRAAILQGEPGRALELLERHRRIFHDGSLLEERDAMRVEALVLAHRYDEARAAADAFRARVPGSLFLSTVDASVGSIP